MSIASEFLQWLRPDGPWLLTAIDPESQQTTTKLLRNAGQVEAFVTEHNQACNVYYHVNATDNLRKRAKKDDIVAIESLHTDLDPRDDEEPEAGKARYLQRLNGGGIAPIPSAIVDSSNGLNCLWRLTVPLPLPPDPQQRAELIADVEERNRALAGIGWHRGNPEHRSHLATAGDHEFPQRGQTPTRPQRMPSHIAQQY